VHRLSGFHLKKWTGLGDSDTRMSSEFREPGTASERAKRQYWLLLAAPDTWHTLRDETRWVFSEKIPHLIEIKAGDLAVVYVMKRSTLVSILQFQGPSKLSRRSGRRGLASLTQDFPVQAPIRYLWIARRAVKLRHYIEALTFIQIKDYWGLYFRGKSLRRLTQSDFEVLASAITSHYDQEQPQVPRARVAQNTGRGAGKRKPGALHPSKKNVLL
jgi:predicted RNA-binding protein